MPSAERQPKDPAEKAAAHAQAQLEERTAVDDLRWLMGDVRGRRVWYRLQRDAGIYRTTWTGEALSLAFNEGARNFGIRYLMNPLLLHCPKRLSEMQRENLKHASNIEGDEGRPNPPNPAG